MHYQALFKSYANEAYTLNLFDSISANPESLRIKEVPEIETAGIDCLVDGGMFKTAITFTAIVSRENALLSLALQPATKIKVTIVKEDGTLIFFGYLIPSTYELDFAALDNIEIEMAASDFKLLEDTIFCANGAIGENQLLYNFEQLLKKTCVFADFPNVILNVNVSTAVEEFKSVVDSLSSRVFIDKVNLFDEDGIGRCDFDILDGILRAYGYILKQHLGQLFLIEPASCKMFNSNVQVPLSQLTQIPYSSNAGIASLPLSDIGITGYKYMANQTLSLMERYDKLEFKPTYQLKSNYSNFRQDISDRDTATISAGQTTDVGTYPVSGGTLEQEYKLWAVDTSKLQSLNKNRPNGAFLLYLASYGANANSGYYFCNGRFNYNSTYPYDYGSAIPNSTDRAINLEFLANAPILNSDEIASGLYFELDFSAIVGIKNVAGGDRFGWISGYLFCNSSTGERMPLYVLDSNGKLIGYPDTSVDHEGDSMLHKGMYTLDFTQSHDLNNQKYHRKQAYARYAGSKGELIDSSFSKFYVSIPKNADFTDYSFFITLPKYTNGTDPTIKFFGVEDINVKIVKAIYSKNSSGNYFYSFDEYKDIDPLKTIIQNDTPPTLFIKGKGLDYDFISNEFKYLLVANTLYIQKDGKYSYLNKVTGSRASITNADRMDTLENVKIEKIFKQLGGDRLKLETSVKGCPPPNSIYSVLGLPNRTFLINDTRVDLAADISAITLEEVI